jgi:hypothetical protein
MVYFASINILVATGILGWFDVATNFIYQGIINIGILGIMLGFIVSMAYYMLILWLPSTKSYQEYVKNI